ncbi:hypothetical protein CONPUDRAFT_156971 [Coniophora puteana RWD-64-598 SS2]|uniref:Uncharacterized protein n=1 Tax=Coniophora puteana (strain RWD-64-598) TaxID=741705 RepID=A0A5M3MFL4_CONPW|nr:uncharacterized protein CONPUDRAFT_156971 [Coniophora puteana RWD-64-598 SS2]EIW77786.1 hypothetical protein CONPUDRAFT_156971 [Coniophora puteana RWD-64-598 SS2]
MSIHLPSFLSVAPPLVPLAPHSMQLALPWTIQAWAPDMESPTAPTPTPSSERNDKSYLTLRGDPTTSIQSRFTLKPLSHAPPSATTSGRAPFTTKVFLCRLSAKHSIVDPSNELRPHTGSDSGHGFPFSCYAYLEDLQVLRELKEAELLLTNFFGPGIDPKFDDRFSCLSLYLYGLANRAPS